MDRIFDLGRTAMYSLAVALGWSVAMWFAAFTVPIYSSDSTSSDRSAPHSSLTLVGQNGLSAIVVVSIPLILALLVAGSLAFVPWPAGRIIAWTLTGLLVAFNVLALLSVGIFLVPVTLGLVMACVTCRHREAVQTG
jgi:hypothetical protein